MKKTRIAVLGLGGVGGFVGAKLAGFYQPGGDVEVSFVARGDTLRAVHERGLSLNHLGCETIGRPAKISDNPADLGVQDFLICAVKAYDLDGLVESLKPAVGKGTVIVPFLNGVEGTEKLRAAFPENTVADGCVFIVSEIVSPGIVKSSMEKYSYMFGLPHSDSETLKKLESLLVEADIRAVCTQDIERIVWEKFAFISPISTLMSCVQKTFGEMFGLEENRLDLKGLLREFCEFAAAKKADLGSDAFDKTMQKYEGMSASFTTSMQRDFMAHKRSELETLTGYVLKNAKPFGLSLPFYEKYYKALKAL